MRSLGGRAMHSVRAKSRTWSDCQKPPAAPVDDGARKARLSVTCSLFVSFVFMFAALPLGVRAAPIPKLVVLDIELIGDLGGPQFEQEHAQRLRMESATLREELARSGLYGVVDNAPAQSVIDRLNSEHAHLYDCNGCDLEIGRKLAADQVIVTWVDRVSGLILSLTYEIHDVASGQIVGRKSYDFRGDNDSSWSHAIRYMVRDMREAKQT
jgi:hypothetical protein